MKPDLSVSAEEERLRRENQDLKRELEQVIDEVSQDELLEAGASEEAKDKARALVADFERYIADNKDEMLYERKQLAGDLPFAELKRRAHINDAARAANDSPDFSRLIRVNRPGFN